jgi:hypothetical protein
VEQHHALLGEGDGVFDSSLEAAAVEERRDLRGADFAEHGDVDVVGMARTASQHHGESANQHVSAVERPKRSDQVRQRSSEVRRAHGRKRLRSSRHRRWKSMFSSVRVSRSARACRAAIWRSVTTRRKEASASTGLRTRAATRAASS